MSLDGIQLLTNLRSRTLLIKDMPRAMSLRREVILVLLKRLDAVIRIRLSPVSLAPSQTLYHHT